MPIISFSNNRRTFQCFDDTPRILGSSNIEMILMTATQVLCTKLNRPAFIRFMFGFFRITVRNIQMHGNAIRPQDNRIGLQQPNYCSNKFRLFFLTQNRCIHTLRRNKWLHRLQLKTNTDFVPRRTWSLLRLNGPWRRKWFRLAGTAHTRD